jgi:hypothetical protein
MTLHELARETWESGVESLDDVVARMRSTIASDKALFKALLEPIILSALRDVASQTMRDERRVVLGHRAAVGQSQPSGTLVDGIKRMAERNLLDFRLSGGRRLGDCTGAEVAADADARQTRINTEVTTVRWQRLIVKSLSAPAAVVGAELDHEKLDALLAQAGNGKRVEVAA